MPLPIEDYALIGDCRTALVGRDGSIDWLCLPRFDAPACFVALLGTAEHGRWLVTPAGPVRTGTVAVIDAMPLEGLEVVRLVEGRRGRVPMRMELVIRRGYGSLVPWATSPRRSRTSRSSTRRAT